MSFPIRVQVFHRRHTGGSKDYYAACLTNKHGQGIYITTYGKASRIGLKTEDRFLRASDGTMAWQRKCRDKGGRDYSISIVNKMIPNGKGVIHHSLKDVDCDGYDQVIGSISELDGSMLLDFIKKMHLDNRKHLLGDDDAPLNEAYHEVFKIAERIQANLERQKREVEEEAERKRLAAEEAAFKRNQAANASWGDVLMQMARDLIETHLKCAHDLANVEIIRSLVAVPKKLTTVIALRAQQLKEIEDAAQTVANEELNSWGMF